MTDREKVADLISAAQRILVEHHDIVDGDGKQLPNWAMQAHALLEEAYAIVAHAMVYRHLDVADAGRGVSDDIEKVLTHGTVRVLDN